MERYDVYFTDDGSVLIYERGDLGTCGMLPDYEPVHKTSSDGDWEDWLDEHTDWRDEKRVRVCHKRVMVNASFIKDLVTKAQMLFDRYREEGARLGWGELSIDTGWTIHTYRGSADWKNEPVRYTFDQRLAWSNLPKSFDSTEALWARDNFVRLVGMSDAAYELGFHLVFDKDFKVYAVGLETTWETEYEY